MVNAPYERPLTRVSALKLVLQRFSFLLLILASVALMLIDRIDPAMYRTVRTRVVDAFTPALDLFAWPASEAARGVEWLMRFGTFGQEVERLRAENEHLAQWREIALRLQSENQSLRALLHFRPDPNVTFVTARVIAAPGGSYVRSVIVTAGRRDGIKPGLAVISGRGLVGRVVEVGEWSARVMLITDISARIPVVLEGSRQRAMLAGNNGEQPHLLYLPPEVPVAVGGRVVSSGHDGLFPPGLPVGTVASVTETSVRVQPLVDFSRIEHVQIVDFGLTGALVRGPE